MEKSSCLGGNPERVVSERCLSHARVCTLSLQKRLGVLAPVLLGMCFGMGGTGSSAKTLQKVPQ